MSSLSLSLSHLSIVFCSHLLLPVRGVLALDRAEGHARALLLPARAPAPIHPSLRPLRLAIAAALSADKGAEFGWSVSDSQPPRSVSPEPKPSWLPTLVAQRNPGRTDGRTLSPGLRSQSHGSVITRVGHLKVEQVRQL